MSLRDRFRPWYGLTLLVFLFGAGLSLWRSVPDAAPDLLAPVVNGLFAVVVFRFTVGNVWGYAVEYRNAGGRWSDAPFLAPFAVALLVAAAALWDSGSVAAAAWTAFWAFVVAAGVVALAVWLAVGYRESSQPAG